MENLDILKTTLLDLDRELSREQNIPLTIGGGFGLHLKQEQLKQENARTLIQNLPNSRSTNDIDMFIRVDCLVEFDKMKYFSECLTSLGFVPDELAPKLHWIRKNKINLKEHEVKIDLLVGPYDKDSAEKLKYKKPRVRPRGGSVLHAYATKEAIEIDSQSTEWKIEGMTSDGSMHAATIFIPQTFTYLLMKLFAFYERRNDQSKELGIHHAMDIYRIVAMTTETELDNAKKIYEKYRQDAIVLKSKEIILEHFTCLDAKGVLAIREHGLFSQNFQLELFISVLMEIFGVDDLSR